MTMASRWRKRGRTGGRREGAAGRRGACARPWLISRAAAGSGLRAADLVSHRTEGSCLAAHRLSSRPIFSSSRAVRSPRPEGAAGGGSELRARWPPAVAGVGPRAS